MESASEKKIQNNLQNFGVWNQLAKILLPLKGNQLHLWLCPRFPPLLNYVLSGGPLSGDGRWYCACNDDSCPGVSTSHGRQQKSEPGGPDCQDEAHHTLLPSWCPRWHCSACTEAWATPSSMPPVLPRDGLASDLTVTLIISNDNFCTTPTQDLRHQS